MVSGSKLIEHGLNDVSKPAPYRMAREVAVIPPLLALPPDNSDADPPKIPVEEAMSDAIDCTLNSKSLTSKLLIMAVVLVVAAELAVEARSIQLVSILIFVENPAACSTISDCGSIFKAPLDCVGIIGM